MVSIIDKCGWALNTTASALRPSSVRANHAHAPPAIAVPTTCDGKGISIKTDAWYPCTSSLSLYDHFSHAKHGPLLRTLCAEWRALGSPTLECVQELRCAHLHDVDVYQNLFGSDIYNLETLATKQEDAIERTLNAALQSTQPFYVTKPFETFASQLGLFATIQAELQCICSPEKDRTAVYHMCWRTHLQTFDEARKACQTSLSTHLCLGYLCWGEAYLWPLNALMYAFLGYSQNGPMDNNVQMLAWPSSRITRSDASSFSSSQMFTESERSIVTSPLSIHAPLLFTEKQESLSDAIVRNLRRPALSHFWEHGIAMMFASVGVALVQQQPDDHANVVPSPSIVNMSPVSLHRHRQLEQDPKWLTRIWTLRTNTPLRAYSIEVSPKGTFAPRQYYLDVVPSPIRPTVPVVAKVSEIEQAQAQASEGVDNADEEGEDDDGEGDEEKDMDEEMKEAEQESRKKQKRPLNADTQERLRHAGRLRSQRHHLRLMQQRNATYEIVEELREVTRSLWSNGCAGTQMAEAMMNVITALDKDGERTFSQANKAGTAATTVTLTKDRKKQSKKRLRDADQHNVLGIACASAVLVNMNPEALSRALQTSDTGENSTNSPELRAQRQVLHVWMTMKHIWPDLVMAEKRLYPHGVPKGESVAKAVYQLQHIGQ